jgi:predicted membrane protein
MNIIFFTVFTVLYALLGGFTLVAVFIFCWLLCLARKEERERDAESQNAKTFDDTHNLTTYGKRAG